MMVCHFCHAILPEKMAVYRNTVCPSCGKDLKICLNCNFYEPGAHWDCKENIPEPVREKDKANFCGFFRFKQIGKEEAESLAEKRKSAFEQKQSQARKQFDSLFGEE